MKYVIRTIIQPSKEGTEPYAYFVKIIEATGDIVFNNNIKNAHIFDDINEAKLVQKNLPFESEVTSI